MKQRESGWVGGEWSAGGHSILKIPQFIICPASRKYGNTFNYFGSLFPNCVIIAFEQNEFVLANHEAKFDEWSRNAKHSKRTKGINNYRIWMDCFDHCNLICLFYSRICQNLADVKKYINMHVYVCMYVHIYNFLVIILWKIPLFKHTWIFTILRQNTTFNLHLFSIRSRTGLNIISSLQLLGSN